MLALLVINLGMVLELVKFPKTDLLLITKEPLVAMISMINILKGLDGFIQKLLNMSPMIKPYSRCIPSIFDRKKKDHAW
jgi:hypothetical protein